MLNKYQHDVLAFFQEYSPAFLEHLADRGDHPVVLVTHVMPQLIDFLDKFIKLEIDLYDQHSPGYHKLQDMLIEIHIMKPDSEIYTKLSREIDLSLRL